MTDLQGESLMFALAAPRGPGITYSLVVQLLKFMYSMKPTYPIHRGILGPVVQVESLLRKGQKVSGRVTTKYRCENLIQ